MAQYQELVPLNTSNNIAQQYAQMSQADSQAMQAVSDMALRRQQTQAQALNNQSVAYKMSQERASAKAIADSMSKAPIPQSGPPEGSLPAVMASLAPPAAIPGAPEQAQPGYGAAQSQINPAIPGAPAQAQPDYPTEPSWASVVDHPLAQQLYAAGNHADTNSALSDNPTPASHQILPNGFAIDRDALYKSLQDSGHAELIPDYQQRFLAADQASQLAKNESGIKNHAAIVGQLAALQSLPDSMRGEAYQNILGSLPGQGVDISGMPATYDNNYVSTMASQATTAQQKLVEAHAAAKDMLDKRKQDEAGSMTDSQKASNALGWARLNYEKSKDSSASTPTNIPASIEDVPYNLKPLIQGIADNSIRPETVSVRPSNGKPSRADVLSIVKNIYPGWNENLSTQAAKTIVDAAPTGKTGQSLGSLSTIADHLVLARQAKTALSNGDIPALNRIANSLGQATGSDKQIIYETIVGVIGGEADKLMSGGNPTQQGSKDWANKLGVNASPYQSEGALTTLEAASAGKIHGIDQGYYNASNVHLSDTGLISPAAKALLSKYPNPADITQTNSQMQMKQPGGVGKTSVPTIHSQADYDALPKGASYVDSNGKRATKR